MHSLPLRTERFVVLALVLVPIFSCAQSQLLNPTYFGIRANSGFIWAHSPGLIPQSYSHPTIYQIEWSRVALSDRAWENCHCYSKLGVAFQYVNFHNPMVLGQGYSLMAFTEPFLTSGSSVFFSLRAGLGPVYLNQVYDKEQNPENLFFSAPVSFVVLLNLTANVRLDDHLILNASGSYNHISNGGVKLPNKGINYPTLGIGVDYIFNPSTMTPKVKTREFDADVHYFIGTFFSPRSARTDEHDKGYEGWMFGMNGGARKQVGSFSAVGLGAEVSYDGSLAKRQAAIPTADHPLIASALVQYYLTFGQFSFVPQFGYYLLRDSSANEPFFQRWALLYTTGSAWYFGTSLKAHGHVAEHIDAHVGIRLR